MLLRSSSRSAWFRLAGCWPVSTRRWLACRRRASTSTCARSNRTRDGPFSSEVELRELVDMAEQRGVVEHDERQMIQSVFELGNTIAREVMVPRTDVVWIERDKTVSQAMALGLRSGFSRIPVIGENADDVVGVVQFKDLARRAQDADHARTTLVEDVMRPIAFVPESKPVDEL